MRLICLFYDTGTETAGEPGTRTVGEQGDYYDPLFTYKEGDEASYFVVSEDSRGDAADVGPSGAGNLERESNGFQLYRMDHRGFDE